MGKWISLVTIVQKIQVQDVADNIKLPIINSNYSTYYEDLCELNVTSEPSVFVGGGLYEIKSLNKNKKNSFMKFISYSILYDYSPLASNPSYLLPSSVQVQSKFSPIETET